MRLAHLARLALAAVALLASGCASSSGAPSPLVRPNEVASIAEFQARIDRAVAGDTIVLRDGVYATTAPITINRQGTATAPIRIVARSMRGATIGGSHGFNVVAPAAYVEIAGFTLTHAAGTNQIASGATHIRFSRNVFENSGNGAYLTIAGNDAEIDRNEFRNKKTLGNMIDVRGSGSQVAQRLRIHDNYFHDFANAGGNGAETIRFGLSGLSMSAGLGVIEHNLFVHCTGENELISVKSGSNILRYNTLLDSPGAQLTMRHGNENQVYGNYLRGTDGIRIFGDRNQVFSNYFEANTGGINIGNGDGEVADGAPLTSHDRPDGTVIKFNTLVNNDRQYYMTARKNGLGATSTVFANNVIVGGATAVSLDGPYSGGVWSGNVVWQSGSTAAMPPGSYETVDPMLERNTAGLMRPRAQSPLIDSPVTAKPLTVDEILRVIGAP